MEKLLNQFYLLVNNTINIHYKGMIYYNFYLVFQVFDEENEFFNDYSYKKRRVLTSGFDKRYEQYIAKFEEYLYMTFSYNFLNFIEKYFYKLRDDILNHIKDKLLVLNKYYFDTEKYKNKFYFIEQTYNEIFKFIDNINNYYNEMNLDGNLKLKAFTIAEEELTSYHNKKIKALEEYYNKLYKRATHCKIKDDDCCDFICSKKNF